MTKAIATAVTMDATTVGTTPSAAAANALTHLPQTRLLSPGLHATVAAFITCYKFFPLKIFSDLRCPCFV